MRALFTVCVLAAAIVLPGIASAQSPELSMREFASGQIKKGVRAVGFGGDGATWGNYALVYRDAGGALVDGGLTHYGNGNDFTFTAVGATSPPLWHGLAIYAIALSQHAEGIHLALASPGLGPTARPMVGAGADQALFVKAALPIGSGVSAGILASYELSQFQASADEVGAQASSARVRYRTTWRPSGGFGVTWQPDPRLLFGTRAILNHDHEVREDAAGTSEGLARSYELRLGGSVAPWAGGLLDLGGTYFYRKSGLGAAPTSTLHPNLGVEQALFGRALTVRAGLDETSYGAGLTFRRPPVQLDLAYIYDLGKARVGDVFGVTSNSVLATFTLDMLGVPRPPPPPGASAP